MRAIGMLAAAIVAGSATASAAEPEKVVVRPTLEIETGLVVQRLVAEIGSSTAIDRRSLWVSRAAAGVDVRFAEGLIPVGRLRVLGSLGLGYVFETGTVPVHLGGAALWQADVTRRLSFPIGVATRVVFDTSAVAQSSLEIGIPLGVRFGVAEIAYTPAMVIPFGSTARPVFGGERRVGPKPGIAPGGLVLRFILG